MTKAIASTTSAAPKSASLLRPRWRGGFVSVLIAGPALAGCGERISSSSDRRARCMPGPEIKCYFSCCREVVTIFGSPTRCASVARKFAHRRVDEVFVASRQRHGGAASSIARCTFRFSVSSTGPSSSTVFDSVADVETLTFSA